MPISTQLYKGERISFTPIDHEKDSIVEAQWTHDPNFMRMMYLSPMKPINAAQVKKRYEEIEKGCEEGKDQYHFQIRLAKDSRLIGFCQINSIQWNHRNGDISMGIGDAAFRGQGYGTEALQMLVNFAFNEINLARLNAFVPEYNQPATRLLLGNGFTLEGKRRQAIFRDLKRWDMVNFGRLAVDQC